MSYPHRVLQVRMVLIDEESGERLFQPHVARIHATDLAAGRMHLEMKTREIWKDAEFFLSKAAVA